MASTAERTDPELWEKVKRELTNSDKGGEKGEWSARKAQLAVQEYKKRGGGYRGRPSKDNSLRQWTEEEWGTRSGRKSTETGERYLPKKAREALSKREYERTTRKKKADKARGKQFSQQPQDVAQKTAPYRHEPGEPADAPTKGELMEKAREKDIDGRSKMSKDELREAVEARSDGGTPSSGSGGSRQGSASEASKRDLDDAARLLGVGGRSRMSKDDLRRAVADALSKRDPDELRKADLKDMAYAFGVEGASRMNKGDLHAAVRSALA